MISIDILIPTYNRAKPLLKNLLYLKRDLERVTNASFNILISDNASSDDTITIVESFIKENPNIKTILFKNYKNLGATRNIISLIQKSTADYIFLTGDDDFTNYEYLQDAVNALNADPEIACILPAFEAISETGERLGYGRDLGEHRHLYDAGIENMITNTPRAHQISGILVKRKGLLEEMLANNITNLYPQMYAVAHSCLIGKCLHIPEYPILVTQTNNKAWSYDKVGLLNDIFQNYAALNIKDSWRFKAEKKFILSNRWRFLRHWNNPFKQLDVIFSISFGLHTSKRGHFIYPFLLTYCWLYHCAAFLKTSIKHTLKNKFLKADILSCPEKS